MNDHIQDCHCFMLANAGYIRERIQRIHSPPNVLIDAFHFKTELMKKV